MDNNNKIFGNELHFKESVKTGKKCNENVKKEFSLGDESQENQERNKNSLCNSVIPEESSYQCISLQLPKESHRRQYCHGPLETIDECDIYDYADICDSYSTSTVSSSNSGCSFIYEDFNDNTDNMTSFYNSVDEDNDIHTLYCIEDWIWDEEEQIHEQGYCEGIFNISNLHSKWKNPVEKTSSTKKHSSSYIPLVNDTTTSSVALLKYACRNHQYEKSLMEKHQPDSPGGDRNSIEHHHITRSSIPPVYGAPDELPHILKDNCPPTETINVVRKNYIRNACEDDKEDSIAVSPKESVIDIRKNKEFEIEHNSDSVNNIEATTQKKSTTLNLKALLNDKQCDTYPPEIERRTELPHPGVNNMLNVLVNMMTEKVNHVIDLAINNEPTQFDLRKERNLEQQEKHSHNREMNTAMTDTERLIHVPKRCNSDNFGNFSSSKQSINTKILQELINLVTTTISQLKLITQGQIMSDCTQDCPTLFISTSAGPATATILSDDFFIKPAHVSMSNETTDNSSESFLDVDFMYQKIRMAEAVDVLRKSFETVDENDPSHVPNCLSYSTLDQNIVNNIKCKSNPDTNTIFPVDLTSFHNSVLLGNYAAENKERSFSSPSLLLIPKENFDNQSLSSLQNTSVLQMLRTTPTSTRTPTGGNTLSNRPNKPPVEIVTHGEGVIEIVGRTLENHLSKYNKSSFPNYELRTLPATKESEYETFTQHQRSRHKFSQHLTNVTSDKNLQNDCASATSVTSSNMFINHQLQLCLLSEKPPTERLGCDSAPVLLHPDTSLYVGCLEELKGCVYDPNQYLQRCIAVSTAKKLNENGNDHQIIEIEHKEKLQSINEKNDSKRQIALTNDLSTSQNSNCILSHHISGDYKDPIETKESSRSIGSTTKIKKSSSLLLQKNSSSSTKNVESKKSFISKSSSKKDKARNLIKPPSNKNISKMIEGAVSNVVISSSKTKPNNKYSTKSINKNNHVCIHGSDLSKTLIIVTENQETEKNEKNSENHNDVYNKTVNKLNTQEEIVRWLQQSQQPVNQERQEESKQYKRKKSATYNARKGNVRHGTRNRTLKLILEKMKVLLQPSGTELIKAFSDSATSPPSKKPGLMSHIVLDILMDTVKQGFLKGLSSASDKSELVKIQKALSDPNPDLMVNMLLEKLKAEDPSECSLKETEDNWSDEVMINEERNLIRKNSVNYEIPSDIASSIETSNLSGNIYSNEVMFSGQSSTLANYLGSETSSEKSEIHNKNVTHNMKQNFYDMKEGKLKIKSEKHNEQFSKNIPHPTLKKLYSADLQSSASSKEGIAFDFDYTPVFDITPDPPTAVSVQLSQGKISETSLKSGNCSKPPPHPRSSRRADKFLLQKSQANVELSSTTDSVKSSTADYIGFQHLKNIKMDTVDKYKYEQNCMIDSPEMPVKFAQYSRQYSYALVGGNDFATCEEEEKACFGEHLPSAKNSNESSLQWVKYSSQPICNNYPLGIDNVESEKVYKKRGTSPKLHSKSGRAWNTPENFFKDCRYSQRNISFRCNGHCSYRNPKVYAKPCPPCRKIRAENLSMDYMESILGDVLNKFINKSNHHRNIHPRNMFMNAVNSLDAAHSVYYSKKKHNTTRQQVENKESKRVSLPNHGPTAQSSKSSPSQAVHKTKLKKERPATSIPTSKASAKKETMATVPVKQEIPISSSSTENNSEIKKKSDILRSHNKKVHSSSRSQQSNSSHRPVTAVQSKSSRSCNRLSALALPTARYLEWTRDRYKGVLEREQLERLDEMMIQKRTDKSNARIHVWKENSSTSYQDVSSSSSSSSSDFNNDKPRKRKKNINMESVVKTKIEGILNETDNYDVKLVKKDNLKSKKNEDVDTIILGGYLFMGVEENKMTSSPVCPLNEDKTFVSQEKNKKENNYICGNNKIDLNVRRTKTDKSILTDERGFRHRTIHVKPEDHFRTNTENSLSDNMISPRYAFCHNNEPPIEKSPVPPYDTIRGNNVYKHENDTIGSAAIKLLEHNILNMMPTIAVQRASNYPYSSESEINELTFTDHYKNKVFEDSNIGVKEQRKHFKIMNEEIADKMLKTVLQAVPEDSLESLDSVVTQSLEDDSSFNNGSSSLSMPSEMHKHCIKAVYNKIESLLAGTEPSEISDSDSSLTYSQPSYSGNISNPGFLSSLSNDESICKNKQLEIIKINNPQAEIPERMRHTELRTVETVKKTTGKTILEIRTRRKSHESEIIPNFNTNSNKKNNVKEKSTYSVGCQVDINEQNKAVIDKTNLKNILQIKVSSVDNNIVISLVSQHQHVTSSNESKILSPKIDLDNSKQTRKICARMLYITMRYNLYEAIISCKVEESYIKITFEHISIFETCEKIVSDYNKDWRYSIELIEKIATSQIFYIELSNSPPSINYTEIMPTKPSSNLNEVVESQELPITKIDTHGEMCSLSLFELLPSKLCCDYHCFRNINTSSYADLFHLPSSTSTSTIVSNIQAFANMQSLTNIDTMITAPFLEQTLEETSNISIQEMDDLSQVSSTLSIFDEQCGEDNFPVNDLETIDNTNNPYCNESLEITRTSSHVLDIITPTDPVSVSPLSKSLDLICVTTQRDIKGISEEEEEELSIYDLTTPDTVKDLIAAFSHVPNEAVITSSTSHAVIESTQSNLSSTDDLDDLLEALTNLNSSVIAEEESFKSDLSSLGEFLERLTSKTTVDSSYEEVARRHILGMRHMKQEAKVSEIASTFGILNGMGITEYSCSKDISSADFRKYDQDRITTSEEEICRTIKTTEDKSLLLYNIKTKSDTPDDVGIQDLREEMVENYLPVEETRFILQNVLDDVLRDILNEEDKLINDMEPALNITGCANDTITNLFPQSLEEKSIPITGVVAQIIKVLNLDENMKCAVNVLINTVRVDSVATHKLVQRITSEMALIPKEEMEMFMGQVFGLDPTEISFDSMFNNLYSTTEMDIQLSGKTDSSKLSDQTTSTNTYEQLEKDILEMEQLLETVKETSTDLAQGFSQLLKEPFSNLETDSTSEVLTLSEKPGTSQSIIEYDDYEWSELHQKSLENLATSSEFAAALEALIDDTTSDSNEKIEQTLLDSELEENIIMLHSVLNAEEQVLSGAGDGVITPRGLLQQHDSTFNAWAVLSLEDIIRNEHTHYPLNVQTSSLSVVVSNSVADYDAIPSYSTAPLTVSLQDSEPSLTKSYLTIMDGLEEKNEDQSSDISMGYFLDRNSEETLHLSEQDSVKDYVKEEHKLKCNVTLSRRTKAFATVYFILFSLIFGGLAFQTQCQQ